LVGPINPRVLMYLIAWAFTSALLGAVVGVQPRNAKECEYYVAFGYTAIIVQWVGLAVFQIIFGPGIRVLDVMVIPAASFWFGFAVGFLVLWFRRRKSTAGQNMATTGSEDDCRAGGR
jgi:disulfide bond formation protein DsbB